MAIKSYGWFTPSSRDYTLRLRGFLCVRFGKWHGAVYNCCQRCRTVREISHDVSIVITQIKSRHLFAHRQKCRDISSMPTAVRCELDINDYITISISI